MHLDEDVSTSLLCTASWALWDSGSEHAVPVPRAIDAALAGYVFYPEAEWARFGYRPPENVPLLGAWRDPGGKVFAFLLDSDPKDSAQDDRRLLFYVSGIKSAVYDLGAKVTALKSVLAKSEGRELRVLHTERRIEQEKKSPVVARLLKLIGLFTVMVNAFSLSLRKLPPPNLHILWVQDTYLYLVVMIHFAALFLLLIITLIAIGYVLRYGILMMRRF